mmetsp:Transcript_17354/g.42419  ORF Transcript_17354/g.42419 Transcript_17354/m.42419 type:complete len:274 (-) Transcript_17354:179-1000(-)|eukprot:CAMPEP_0206229880 /NCGR_PEP_ID=MMETSP0047_2-20121206/9940_1 /ASSEMBLY_ACC=CAM_ASM_000192 /TAXON_ID=195065 /ORGANISM="Chroomonas mesostigmatica_cf, Strain CCMP1168" /LENGTH=273 /DNA_ID=CAMNT_0053653223 /DNA_START=178 /DNA_END=999 /DNA_ORIENTATION=+
MPKKIEAPEENPGTRKLVGVFTSPPPLCLGEPYNDKRMIDGRHRGKGLSAGFFKADEKTRQCAPGNFKLSPFLFANEDMKGKEPYKEAIRYRDRFPTGAPRPRNAARCGFLSADYPKRDEYTNTIRTEQLREVLRREYRISKSNKKKEEERFAKLGIRPQSAQVGGGLQKMPLYDLVFRIPEMSLKQARDDRQGRIFFSERRRTEKALAEGTLKPQETKLIEGHAWVSVGMPNGNVLEVLVDADRQVLAKRAVGSPNQPSSQTRRIRPMSAHI